MTAISTPFNFIIITYLAIERAKGNTKKSMSVNAYSLVLKIVFSFLFTVIIPGEIVGIGVATILAKGLCALLSVKRLLFEKTKSRVLVSDIHLNIRLAKILILKSIPLVIEKSLISFGFVIINKYVIEFGEPVLAAYGLTNRVNSMFFKSSAAFGTGLSVIVAQNLGAKQMERVKSAIAKTYFFATMFSTVCFFAILLPFRADIASMFVERSDPTYQHIINAMGVYTIAVIPWSVSESTLGVFQGASKTYYNLIISIVRIYGIRLPVVMFFSQSIWGFQEYGIWYAMLLSNILSAVFSAVLLFVKRKKVLQTIDT